MSRYLNFHFPTTSTRSHLRHLRSPHGGSHTTPVDSWPIPWRFDMNFPTLRPGKKRVTVGSFITLPFFEQREKKPGGFFSRFQDGFFPTDVFVQSTLFLFRKCRKRRNGWWEKKKHPEKSQHVLENCPRMDNDCFQGKGPCRTAQNRTSLCGVLRTSDDFWN